MTILLDVESRSRADLRRVGGRLYWQHPSSEILCLAWHDTQDGSSGIWRPGEHWPHEGRELCAHNAVGFDRFALARYELADAASPAWVDSSELARRAGLPGSLDELGRRWLGLPKDKDANRFTVGLSTVRKPKGIDSETWRRLPKDERARKGVQAPYDDAARQRVEAYCAADVGIMVRSWDRLSKWRGIDEDACGVCREINERGVGIDVELARALLAADARLADAACRKAATELGWSPETVRERARSVQQFCEHTGAPNAQKATVGAIDHPLARARRALATIASGKLEAALQRTSDDGRMRDSHRYYGAHTGRWSGRGMQIQNLPRPDKLFDAWDGEDLEALADAAKDGTPIGAAEIDLLLRGVIAAKPGHVLVVRDYSAIEGRGLAWLADDADTLQAYREGRDIYKDSATAIYGVPYASVSKPQRQIGKVAALALGYQGASGAFRAMARAYGLDLKGVDVPSVVTAWRDAHQEIARLWGALDRAFQALAGDDPKSVEQKHTCLKLERRNANIAIHLPSGRLINYPGVSVDNEGASYEGGRAGAKVRTYGGKLVENVTQAICRDLLADALVRANAAGLNPVMHVHDEIVCEVSRDATADAAAELQHIMTKPPTWAINFPLAASGYEGVRYRK